MNTQEHQGKVNVGDKYHRLTAKKFISLVKRSQAMWLWVCDCGKEHLATALKQPRKRLYLDKTKAGVGYITH
nr:MAG: hypothetical protein [Bacteriophage sp.]